jgi:hypothetical protein
VEVVASGHIGMDDVHSYFAALRAEGVLSYRKLVDGRRAAPALDAGDFRAFMGILLGLASRTALGPVAWVRSREAGPLEPVAGRMSLPPRPFRMFDDIDEARLWLSRMPIEI